MKIKCDDVIIGNRVRKDLGELDTLMDSIKELGLLQPIGITEGNELIFGQRRLLSCMMLGLDEIEANIININDIIKGEYAENAIRKDFTMSERDAIRKMVEPKLKEEAKKRQGTRIDLQHCADSAQSQIGGAESERAKIIENYERKEIIKQEIRRKNNERDCKIRK